MFHELEKIRQEGMRKVLITGAVMLVFSLIVLVAASYSGIVFTLMFCLILDIIVLSVVYQSAQKEYVNAYKEHSLKQMLQQEFEELNYEFEKGFSEDEIRDGHLLNLYDRFYSNDYISGKLHGIPFECSDVHIQDVVRSGKSTTVVTRFQGFYLRVPLKKNFHGWLVVREKEFLDNGNPRGFFSEMPQLEKIQVEDEVFNQTYSIYASDGMEAFYLLTPAFIEKMLEFEMRIEGRCLFGFWNNQLHVAVDSRREHFEVSLFSKVDELILHQHQQEIQLIKTMIELIQKECEEE